MIRQAGSTATAGRQVCALILAALIGVWLVLAVRGETAAVGVRVSVPGGTYTNVTAPELKRMLEAKDFFFVNVHVPYDGEIAETDAFIPYDKVQEQLHLLPPKREAKVVLYCMSDRMSTIAAEKLVRLGYSNAWNLQGGMVAWQAQGYPLIQGQRR
ncbi:MAG: rhodanese-like domain-containing protein [candidate division NC10 bacterium]|nr:rhodanese-like domain-containing protein [candidate division NC10 bacterium]